MWKFKLWPVGLVQFCLWRNEVTGLGSVSVTQATDLPSGPPWLGTGSFFTLAALERSYVSIPTVIL